MKTVKFSIVGFRYRVTDETFQTMSEVLPLKAKLVREPDNTADSNAIKVVLLDKPWRNVHVAYITRTVASELAPKLDAGKVEFSDAVITAMDVEESSGEITFKVKSLQKR